MPKVIATHAVDDVAHWLASPKRAEVFAGIMSNIQTYVDPTRPNQVGLSGQIDDMDAFQAVMASDVGADAMKHDGVHADTLLLFFEA